MTHAADGFFTRVLRRLRRFFATPYGPGTGHGKQPGARRPASKDGGYEKIC